MEMALDIETIKRERKRESQRRWKQKNIEHVKEERNRWRKEHPDKVKECLRKWREKNKGYDKEYYARNHERIKSQHRKIGFKTRIKTKYNLTVKEYNEMVKKQNGCCAICERRIHLVVDHDHKTGRVRGLLCNSCNTVLGFINDNPAILRRMMQYLNPKPALRLIKTDQQNLL
jgi:hypothetical protein